MMRAGIASEVRAALLVGLLLLYPVGLNRWLPGPVVPYLGLVFGGLFVASCAAGLSGLPRAGGGLLPAVACLVLVPIWLAGILTALFGAIALLRWLI